MKIEDLWKTAKDPYLKSIGFAVDNPGGDWLEHQRERAEQYLPKTIGANTATIGLISPAMANVSYFIKFPGEMGEHKFRHNSVKQDALASSVKKNGWLEDQATIMVFVNCNGEPKIAEGNHRLAYAHNHGIEWIPIDIRYMAGGERMNGPLSPDKLKPSIIKPIER